MTLDIRLTTLPPVNPGSTRLKGSLVITLKRGESSGGKEYKEYEEFK
jgi:hypothetical protein